MSLFGGVVPITGITFFMFCLFSIAVIGFALGRITVKGVRLGDAAVFIVALLFGCFFYPALQAQLSITAGTEVVNYTDKALKIVESLGLVLFVTSVGFIAGPKFFGNMKQNFKSYVLLGLVVILAGGLSAAGCIGVGRLLGETDTQGLTAMVVGLLSGSLTSTPAFSAAKATVAPQYESLVSVGHGIAYIFGVIGVVLFVQLIPKLTKANMEEERAKLVQAAAKTAEKKKQKEHLLELDEYGFGAFALAAVVGTFVGMIKVPLSSAGLSGTTFALTTTGGCLMTSLVFGHFGKIGPLSIMPKDVTLKVFRELGLMLFLIGAGIPGGADFVQEFQVIYFVYGVVMTILPLCIGYLFAKYVLKLSLLNNLGSITGGMTSTPALGTLINTAGTEDVAAAYAATYPIALIAVVLVSQFLIILF